MCRSENGDYTAVEENYIQKSELNVGQVVEQKEKLCVEVETEWKFMCHHDWVSADGGCEASVTV